MKTAKRRLEAFEVGYCLLQGESPNFGLASARNVWSRWTDDVKTAMGLVWVDDPVVESYDERFYFSANNPKHLDDVEATDFEGNPVYNEDGTRMINTGLKSQWISRTQNTAYGMLKSTDWYAVRQVETGQAIPENLLNLRVFSPRFPIIVEVKKYFLDKPCQSKSPIIFSVSDGI